MPGFPGFPYEQFFQPPYSTADYGREFAATGHLLRDLLTALYTAPTSAYALGTRAASWPESGCSPTAPTGHSTATSWCRAGTETSPI